MEVPHVIGIFIGFAVEINTDDTENSLADAELVWLYVGCFPFG